MTFNITNEQISIIRFNKKKSAKARTMRSIASIKKSRLFRFR